MGCKRRIDRALKNALQLPLNACSRYVIMSDCHRGEGTMNDNFLKNQNLYYAALNCYRERGFFYVELGDGEELWENRSVRVSEAVMRMFIACFWSWRGRTALCVCTETTIWSLQTLCRRRSP